MNMQPETKPTVVVVEDEPGIANLIRDFLEAEGFEVRSANSPAEVEQYLGAEPPDLCLVDLMLPEMTGNALATKLRENGLAHTPMVAMSADSILLFFAGRSGLFQATLPKPFDLSDLLECVRAYAGTYITH